MANTIKIKRKTTAGAPSIGSLADGELCLVVPDKTLYQRVDAITLMVVNSPVLEYVALVSQTGTSAPTATVLKNTLGATISFTRLSAGVYTANASTAVFTTDKTTVQMQSGEWAFGVGIPLVGVSNTSTVRIAVTNGAGYDDGLLIKNALVIKVYP